MAWIADFPGWESFEIPQLNEEAARKAQTRQRQLIKPLGALGRLEALSMRLSAITGEIGKPLTNRKIVVFAADNGVHAQQITTVPQEVTRTQTFNILEGVAGVNALARQAGVKVRVVDIGLARPLEDPRLICKAVRRGTGDISLGPAMTREQCLQAIGIGREMALQCRREGADAVAAGEMGICNTTTAAALVCALTGADPKEVTGRGAGITDALLLRKTAVIEKALALHHPDPEDPVDCLYKVGGLDLAGMAGFYLGAAEAGLPVLADGVISTVAAWLAVRLCPRMNDYLFLSHRSPEPAYALAARALMQQPLYDLGMRLGEGSGCPLGFLILDAAQAAIREMATFDSGGIDGSLLVD